MFFGGFDAVLAVSCIMFAHRHSRPMSESDEDDSEESEEEAPSTRGKKKPQPGRKRMWWSMSRSFRKGYAEGFSSDHALAVVVGIGVTIHAHQCFFLRLLHLVT